MTDRDSEMRALADRDIITLVRYGNSRRAILEAKRRRLQVVYQAGVA